MATKSSVCVAVCTFQRPRMLRECLRSLAKQVVSAGATLKAVVVDNQPDGGNRAAVEELARTFPFPLHYVHQPERGISSARNACLDKAHALGADWLAFIDDDEVANPLWLSQLLSEAEESKADVIGGPVAFHYPKDYPAHLERRKWRLMPNAAICTGNVLISMNFLRGFETAPLFDRNLSASEDRAFFTILRENGAVFNHAPAAVVTETAMVSRYSLWGRIKRGYNGGKRRARERGKSVAFASALRLLVGPLKIALSPLAMLGGVQAFTTVCHAGFRTTASGAGAIAGLFGAEPVFYRDIDGY
jgi:succinoglycan biosynthesis protein ExoM